MKPASARRNALPPEYVTRPAPSATQRRRSSSAASSTITGTSYYDAASRLAWRREERAISEPIISLDDPAARHAAAVGEKAAALARMRQAGLPVPAGFVVEAAAFDEATAALAPRIESHLATATDGIQALAVASRAIQELVVWLRLPPGLGEAVISACEQLVDGASVAVRSSGTAEDLPGASFAGQYSSYLNVTGAESVVERMLDVWASLYSPQAIAYRDRQGVAHSDARMAVLVQRQVAAEAAGVLFTRDPMSGAQDRLLINATFGLGEGVVSGEIPADSFSLDAESLAVVERAVADKTTMMAMQPGGGIEQQPVPAARRREPSLSDERLADLGRLARSVHEIEGGHRDIEFAVVSGDLYLLQARPVTGLRGGDESAEAVDVDGFPVEWDDPSDEEYAWTLGDAVFGAAGPLPRFQEDVQRALAESRRACYEATASPRVRNHIVRFFNGRAYSRPPSIGDAEAQARMRRHQQRDRALREQGSSLYEAEIEPEAQETFDRLNRFQELRCAGLPELVEHLEAALAGFARTMGDLHWRMVGGMRLDWPSVYSELTGEPAVDSGVLLQAIDNKTTQLVRRLRGMARLVREHDELRTLFRQRAYDRIDELPLRDRPTVRRFRDRFRRLLRDYGLHTGGGFGSARADLDPTWNMNPREPLDLIATYAEQDIDELERMETEARRERQRATRRVRRKLSGDPERLARFEQALEFAGEQVQRMENHNYLMEQGIAGALREAIFLLGEGFVRAGMIEQARDAQHLSLEEIRSAAPQRDDLRGLVRQRRADRERRKRMTPPQRLGKGEPPGSGPMPLGTSGLDAPPESAGLDGTTLRGIAAARGRYTGRARVFKLGGERPEIERGDILVALNAGPDWTPVLPLLGGIVLDEGAVFQHAALIAREYRVPCVLQTREATTAIADGQRITIDGDQGVVELAPEAGA